MAECEVDVAETDLEDCVVDAIECETDLAECEVDLVGWMAVLEECIVICRPESWLGRM